MSNILTLYKDLISNYEDMRQIYELTSKDVVKCTKIVAYNDVPAIIRWKVYLLNGLMIYDSGRYLLSETWRINVADLTIAPGTQFVIKAVVTAGPDTTSSVILEYAPESNATAYFELVGGSLTHWLNYIGVVE